MLLGTLPHSGKVRGVLAEKMDQAHLIEAMDEVLRRLGGTPQGVADRPPGHGDRAGNPRRPGLLRSGGQALQRRRRALSAEARQPKGCGRVLRALRLGTLVAHHERPRTPRTPSAPSTSSAPPPATTANAEDRTVSAPRSASWPTPSRCSPSRRPRSRPRPRSRASSPTTPASPSAGNRYSVPPGLSGTTLLVRHRLCVSDHRRGGSVGGDPGHPSPRPGGIGRPGAQPSSTKRPSRPPC